MDIETFVNAAKNYYLLAKRQQLYSYVVTISINKPTKHCLPLHSDSEFLTYFSNHLSDCLRPYDLVCRDNDKILVLLCAINENTAHSILNRIQNFITEQASQIYFEHLTYDFASIFKMEEYYNEKLFRSN